MGVPAKLVAKAARRGCRVEELLRTRDEHGRFEIWPVAEHHCFGGGLHSFIAYNTVEAMRTLDDCYPEPCAADCECWEDDE